MPGNYSSSTPGALSLPIHEDDSHPDRSPSPMWRRTSSSSRTARFSHEREPSTVWGRTQQQIRIAWNRWDAIYWKLTPLQRVLLSLTGILTLISGILFLVFSERIFHWLIPKAQKWRDLRGGWLILWAATFVVSFPPLIGYSACVSLAGIVYGLPNGWFIVASATVAGSTASFLASRTILSKYVNRLLANDKRFAALALTLKHDGLKLLVMIRLCPLPYSLSNGAVATFPTVTWVNFAIATALVTPKLLIHVFIGSRIAAITEHGGEMDFKTKLLNVLSIIFGIFLGVGTGWFIYRQTKARAAELEREEAEHVRDLPSSSLAAEYADDPERQAAATLRDDISLHTTNGDTFVDEPLDELDDAQEVRSERYKDLMSDDEDDDVFRKGDGDTDDEGGDLGRYRA